MSKRPYGKSPDKIGMMIALDGYGFNVHRMSLKELKKKYNLLMLLCGFKASACTLLRVK